MNGLLSSLNQHIRVELKGKEIMEGILAFIGIEIIVVYSLEKYIYICVDHINLIEVCELENVYSFTNTHNSSDKKTLSETITSSLNQDSTPIDSSQLRAGIELVKDETIPFTNQVALENAKGKWVSLFLTPKLHLLGKINEIKDDYLSLYSVELQKEVFISTKHIHFFYLFKQDTVPFGLIEEQLLEKITIKTPLPNTFQELIADFANKFIFINDFEPIYVKSVSGPLLESTTKNGHSIYYQIQHVKAVQSI